MVIPLQEIIHGNVPDFVTDAITGFTCIDKDVETFLKNKAFDFERRDKSRTYVGIILIGQFGKDSKLAKNITGKVLLEICLRTVKKAKNVVGGRFVMLECMEIENVVEFYKANGFQLLQFDERDKFLQMIRRL